MANRDFISGDTVKLDNKIRKKNRFRFKGMVPFLILLPALILTIGVLVPFGMSIYYTLTDYRLTVPNYSFIWFRNYINFVASREFLHYTTVTFKYAFLSVFFEVILGLIIALLLNTETIFAKIFRPLLLLPLMIAPIIGTILWKLMMSPTFGVLNYFLSFIGQRDFGWASDPRAALFSVVLVDIWMFTPFIALLILAGLRSMPKTPFEAATVDGASNFFIFKNLTIPMITPYLIIAVVFRLVDSLRQFDIIYGMTKGGPFDVLMNYQVAAYTQAFTYTDISKGSTIMLVNWIIVYIFSFYLVKYWRKAQDNLA